MAFPETALPVLDAFNRANGAVYAGAGSTIWSELRLNSTEKTGCTVVSEKLSTEGDNNCWELAETGPDVERAIEIPTLPSQYICIGLRTSKVGTTSWNGYLILWGPAVGESVQIRKYVGGSSTTLKTIENVFLSAGNSLGFQAKGSKLTVAKQVSGTWTELGNITDTTYSEKGHCGYWSGDATGRYDSLRGANIGSEKHEYTVGVSETLSPSQAVARSTVANRSSSETLSPSQTITGIYGSNRKPAESLSTSDSVKRAVQVARSVTQTQSTTDTPGFSSPTSFFRSAAEALTTSDVLKRIFTGARSVPDNLTTSDLPSTGNIKERSVTETLSTSDSPKRSTSVARTPAEGLSTSDTPIRSAALHRAVTEALSASDATSRMYAAKRFVTESLSTSDAPTIPSKIIERFVAETLSTSDSAARIFHGSRTITELLSFSETATRSTATHRAMSESQSTADTVARQTNAHRGIADTVHGTDSPSATKAFFKSITETLTTTDAPKRTLGGFVRNVAESNILSGVVSRVYHGFRSIADRVTGTDTPRTQFVTIYHGERVIELTFEEPEYRISANDNYILDLDKPEATAYPEGEDGLRVNLTVGEIRINGPDPTLRIEKSLIDRYLDSEYDDKLAINLEEKPAKVNRST